MTATTRGRHRHLKRPRVRLPSMEALGFIDRPDTTSTWATRVTSTTTGDVVSESAAETFTIEPTVADWKPNEVGDRLLKGNVRWGLVITGGPALALLVFVAFWLYQQPRWADVEAGRVLNSEAAAMGDHLDALSVLSVALIAESPAPDLLAADLARADAQARILFEASGNLPAEATTTRSNAADLAGETLAASRLLRDAFAYRTAALPILAIPELETDPALIRLDEAALVFGEWQSRFDQVRAALPESVLSELTSELGLISGELTATQGRYLDALRQDDPVLAAGVLDGLKDRLEGAESLLAESLSEIRERVDVRLGSARSSLDLLVG